MAEVTLEPVRLLRLRGEQPFFPGDFVTQVEGEGAEVEVVLGVARWRDVPQVRRFMHEGDGRLSEWLLQFPGDEYPRWRAGAYRRVLR